MINMEIKKEYQIKVDDIKKMIIYLKSEEIKKVQDANDKRKSTK